MKDILQREQKRNQDWQTSILFIQKCLPKVKKKAGTVTEDSVVIFYHVDENVGSEVRTQSWLQKLQESAHLVFIGIDGDVVEWRDVFACRVFCGKSVIHLFSRENVTEVLHCALWMWGSYWKRPCTLRCAAFPAPQWWNSCLVLSPGSSSSAALRVDMRKNSWVSVTEGSDMRSSETEAYTW